MRYVQKEGQPLAAPLFVYDGGLLRVVLNMDVIYHIAGSVDGRQAFSSYGFRIVIKMLIKCTKVSFYEIFLYFCII